MILCGVLFYKSDIIGIRPHKQYNEINYHANKEQPACENIQNSHTCFSFVKLMSAKKSKEKSKQKCDPLIPRGSTPYDVRVAI